MGGRIGTVSEWRFLATAALVVAFVFGGAAPAAAQADNDVCIDAIPVAVPSLTAGSTAGTTPDQPPAFSCGTSVGTGGGVWYSVTGTGSTMTASTCNDGNPDTGSANYDTKINVYCTDCALPTCVAGVDDSDGCAGFSTRLSWCSEAGREYLILVNGFSTASGDFTLSLSDDATSCGGSVACSGPSGADVGSTACGQVQSNTQLFVGDEDPAVYRNHGKYVKSVAHIVGPLEDAGNITEECASCIVSQFARRVPVAEQASCSCGNGVCEPLENPETCSADCGFCGDATCNPDFESGGNCSADCPSCADRSDLCGADDTEVPGGNCYCDAACFSFGDCCSDVCDVCTSLPSCP